MGFGASLSVVFLELLFLGFSDSDALRGVPRGNRQRCRPLALICCHDHTYVQLCRRWGTYASTAKTGANSPLKRLCYSTNGESDYQTDQRWLDESTRSDEDTPAMLDCAIQRSPPLAPRQHSILTIDSKLAAVCSRTVPITPSWSITVWEWQSVAPVIETFWQVEQQGLQVSRNLEQGNRFDVGRDTKQQEEAQSLMLDPFGLVTWPGSVVATLELMRHQALVKDRVVFVIGAGVGVEAQAAAALGAKRVIATDVHPTTLKLLEHGVQQASDIDPNCVESRIWDLFGSDDVPHEVDLIVCADVLYNDKLAFQLIKRISKVYETSDAYFVDGTAADGHNVAVPTTSMSSPGNASRVNVDLREGSRPLTPHNSSAIRKPPATLIVDSQRFCHGFEHDLNAALKRSGRRGKVAWESRYLPSFTGSGILVEEDQTYDVKARVLWIGL